MQSFDNNGSEKQINSEFLTLFYLTTSIKNGKNTDSECCISF